MPSSDYRLARKVGAKIRARREKLGLTQAQLAAKMGTNGQAISKVELGERGLTIVSLYDFARVLKCAAGKLLP